MGRECLAIGIQPGDGDRVISITSIHHKIATPCHQGRRIIGDIGVVKRQQSTTVSSIDIGLKIVDGIDGAATEGEAVVVVHYIGIHRDRVAYGCTVDRGIGFTSNDVDAFITSISSGDIKSASESCTSQIANQVGNHLLGSTEQAEQGVLAKLGGIGGDGIAAAVGSDRGGAGSSCNADGVVGGITGGHRKGAAGVAGQ